MSTYIVIGAGILGASTAYHLAKSGADVTVVDKKHDGQATDAAAGIVCPWLSQRRNKAWYRLAKYGAKYYQDLIASLEADGETNTGYKKVGAISIHTDENKLDKMQERAYKRREDAPEIGDISRLLEDKTQREFPFLQNGFQSVHISGAARVNGRALCEALLAGAKKHGAKLIHDEAKLLYKGKKIRGVLTSSATIEADYVIVTAGAWARDLFEPIGIDLQVTYQKAQIMHLQLDEEDTGSLPVVMPPNDQYILAFEQGKIVIGATHENDTGFDYRVTAGGVYEVLNKALEIAPGLADGAIDEIRVGFRPFTPGFLPIIGAVPSHSNVFLANGLGASGLTVGPYLGSQLAKLALGQEIELPLEDYSVEDAIQANKYMF
ncbi:NAD(P)/FAD-dependent oxidoreductase [Priestia flexa]|uniref:NAD(P)/FAD-dependent oxidoreductase n=1 Tax=Priestia flexa TaxID=86664 RepID=UPI001CD46342|nr:FAD-binding oxidoreductase [Priestia flexa]MCA1201183.1 FAD-binding oxidoreductase [Priestia flexa]